MTCKIFLFALNLSDYVICLTYKYNNFRNVWNSYENCRTEILEFGAIKRITELFVRAAEKSYEPKYAELAETCLKAMSAFVASLDPSCGIQMRGGSDAEGYKCIMKYCEEKNKLAIKCLYSLSQIAECRPSLGSSGAVERLIFLVTRNSVLSWEFLASLCLFCREAVNRARIKHGSGLEVSTIPLFKEYQNVLFFIHLKKKTTFLCILIQIFIITFKIGSF